MANLCGRLLLNVTRKPATMAPIARYCKSKRTRINLKFNFSVKIKWNIDDVNMTYGTSKFLYANPRLRNLVLTEEWIMVMHSPRHQCSDKQSNQTLTSLPFGMLDWRLIVFPNRRKLMKSVPLEVMIKRQHAQFIVHWRDNNIDNKII